MRLGAMVPHQGFDEQIAALQRLGVQVTAVGLDPAWTDDQARAYGQRWRDARIVVAHAGCYTNLESPPGPVREAQISRLQRTIELAAHAGIPHVVSGAGHMHPTRTDRVDIAHPDNWTAAALDRLVESSTEVAALAAAAGVTFCIEPLVTTTLNSPATLAEVVRRVGTRGFGVLLDPVNLMDLATYFDNGRVIQACFDLLGDAIKVLHAKDTLLRDDVPTYHMSETIPGRGTLDYETLLRCIEQLRDPDTALIIEHIHEEHAIAEARDYIQDVAARMGIQIRA